MKELTKQAIKESFLKLLEERPYSEITVKDVAEDCGINRNTFYYHFTDLPTLLESIVEEDCDRIISQYTTVDSLEDGLEVAVEFALQHKRAVMHVYHSVDRAIYEKYLWKVCDYVVLKFKETHTPEIDTSSEKMDAVARYYKYELFGMIMGWMEDGMKDDIYDLIKKMSSVRRGQFYETLNML